MKLFRRIFSAALIVIIFAVGLTLLLKNNQKDHEIEQYIKDNNYPFNGYYSSQSVELSSADLTTKLNAHPQISQYFENINATISEGNKIHLSGNLRNTATLFDTTPQLQIYKMWASSFDGQTVTAEIGLIANEANGTALSLDSLMVGNITIDPKLLSSFIESSALQQEFKNIEYAGIVSTEDSICFSKGCPSLFK